MRHLPLPSHRPPASPTAALLPRLLLLAALLPALAAAPVAAQPFGFGAPAPLNTNAATDSAADFTPCLTSDRAGVWIAAWYSGDSLGGTIGTDQDILFARSLDDGATWSAPAALNTNAATDTGQDHDPCLVTDGLGTWVAAWDSTDSLGGTIGADKDILVARSTDDGATWSAPAALNTNAATDGFALEDAVSLATDGTGTWVATWQSTDPLGGTIGTDDDILVARSTDGGATWSVSAALNGNAAADSGGDTSPDVTTDGTGNWVAVWVTDDSLGGAIGTEGDILTARSVDGGATWSAPSPLNTNATTDVGLDAYPVVANDGAGLWVATWFSADSLGGTIGTDLDILVALSTDAGATWTAPTALDPAAAADAGGDVAPHVAPGAPGEWVAVWQAGSALGGSLGLDYDILISRSTDEGATWSAPAALNSYAATDSGSDQGPRIATDGAGNWVVTWFGADSLGGTIGTDNDILVVTSNSVPVELSGFALD